MILNTQSAKISQKQDGHKRAISRILNQLPFFCYVLFWESITMSGNEATRQLVQKSCFGNCGPEECSEPPVGVQTKPYKAFNSAAFRYLLDVHFFKVNE